MVQISILISLIGFSKRRYFILLIFLYSLHYEKSQLENGTFCYEDKQQVMDDLRKVQNSFPIVLQRASHATNPPFWKLIYNSKRTYSYDDDHNDICIYSKR
ncbi:hypothetical protein V1478_010645 [Vespula squamosa]|uniref:Uncharacterized protein n=1 Tax=Vespula squamosa TaxID=30214 RepID=A0ABD2AID6_VESSQ